MPAAGPFGPWRVWFDGDDVRVARDAYLVGVEKRIQPEHLNYRNNRKLIGWFPHPEAARIPSISVSDFIAWLDQGGHRR